RADSFASDANPSNNPAEAALLRVGHLASKTLCHIKAVVNTAVRGSLSAIRSKNSANGSTAYSKMAHSPALSERVKVLTTAKHKAAVRGANSATACRPIHMPLWAWGWNKPR